MQRGETNGFSYKIKTAGMVSGLRQAVYLQFSRKYSVSYLIY